MWFARRCYQRIGIYPFDPWSFWLRKLVLAARAAVLQARKAFA